MRGDVLFIATAHATRGADASHRGGNPGFIEVLDGKTVRIPDYAGNSMFNTLGNLVVNPAAARSRPSIPIAGAVGDKADRHPRRRIRRHADSRVFGRAVSY